MNAIIWTVIGFFLGAIPFSVILGRLLFGRDIRQVGDGNPGGTNVLRAGNSKAAGVLAIGLDTLKAATPVALAYYAFGVAGWPLVPVILAPIAGHAFSPFLGFRGGKAVASTWGAWSALTVPFGPAVMALALLALYKLVDASGWAVMGAMIVLLLFLAVLGLTWPLAAAWAVTVALLAYKHRAELVQRPRLRR